MQEMIEECYHAPISVLSKNIQQIIKFQKKNKDKWMILYSYIDDENNNIMTNTRMRFPQLEEKDLLMIALTVLGYSCAQIAIVLGYSNATSISTIRQRIANKMGLDMSLTEYIEQFSK